MNEFVYKLTLDINCSKEPPIICAGQFDKGRKFEFTITNNGEPYDITGCSAILKGTRSNNTHFAIDCTVLNGKIIAVTDENTLSVRGKSVAKVVIYDADRIYSTQIFFVDVDPSLEGIITESSDYYPIYSRIIKSITDSEKSANKVSEIDFANVSAEKYPSVAGLMYYHDNYVVVLYTDIVNLKNNKADKATTLEGYGITDAYAKTKIDKLLNNKLNKMPFDDVPALNSPSYLTSGAVYTALLGKADKSTTLSGYGITNAYTKSEVDSKINDIPGGNMDGVEKTANKVGSSTDITDESVNYPSISYLKNYYYDFSETDNLFGEKYDASNIEYGSGTLTIPDVLKDRVLSGSFDYQKIDNWVNIQIYIEFKSYSSITVGSSFSLQGLPFVCINPEKPRGVCLTTTNKQMGWTVAVDSARLTLIHLNSSGFTNSEKLSISIRYKI